MISASLYLVSEAVYTFLDPTLPFKLSLQYGFDQRQIGLTLLLCTACCSFQSLLNIPFADKMNYRLFVSIGLICLAVGCFLMGPSELLRLPDSLNVMRAGFVVGGTGKGLVQCLAYPLAV